MLAHIVGEQIAVGGDLILFEQVGPEAPVDLDAVDVVVVGGFLRQGETLGADLRVDEVEAVGALALEAPFWLCVWR